MRLLPKLEEDRPTPKEVYNFRTYLFASIASAGAATIGYDSAFIGGTIALDSFRKEFRFEEKSQSEVDLLRANIVSCYQAGAFFGALFAYLGGHFLGRRIGLLAFGILFIAGAGIMLAIDYERGFAALYAGRVIAGVGVGAISNLIPIYIAELSPPAIRGRLVGMWEVGWQSGGLIGFWINVSRKHTSPQTYGLANLSPVCRQQNARALPTAVADSFRRPTDPSRYPCHGGRPDRRESSMAYQQWPTRKGCAGLVPSTWSSPDA